MRYRAAQMFPLLLVMVMAVTECGAAGLANSTSLHCSTQEDLIKSVLNNQMALLKDIYESSCTNVSCDSELQELRLMKEEVMGEMEAMQEMKSELEVRMQEVAGQLAAVQEMLETIQNASIITPPQQPDPPATYQPASDPPASYTLHNDTDPSLCGPDKVLYGSKGSLSPAYPWNYSNNMKCKWHVILPEGTHPVFHWDYVDIESSTGCARDSMHITVPRVSHTNTPAICGSRVPSQHPIYNTTDNEFIVTFSSNGSFTRRGFMLHYQAESN